MQDLESNRLARRRFWCVNFDGEQILHHGLEIGCWLFQYQYGHNGLDYQGNTGQIGKIKTTLESAADVQEGDLLVAYLPGNRFFAVGEVQRIPLAVKHHDSIDRTVREHQHKYLEGVVKYEESEIFYEDFTDTWVSYLGERVKGQPEFWRYPQRISVGRWKHVVKVGVVVPGVSKIAKFPEYRKAVFEIDESFYDRVVEKLNANANAKRRR